MSPQELKKLYETAEPEGHFFDPDTMRFFGDTMRNYGVAKVKVRNEQWAVEAYGESPEPYKAWELYRKAPVKCGLRKSAYFSLEGKQLDAVVEI